MWKLSFKLRATSEKTFVNRPDLESNSSIQPDTGDKLCILPPHPLRAQALDELNPFLQ